MNTLLTTTEEERAESFHENVLEGMIEDIRTDLPRLDDQLQTATVETGVIDLENLASRFYDSFLTHTKIEESRRFAAAEGSAN